MSVINVTNDGSAEVIHAKFKFRIIHKWLYTCKIINLFFKICLALACNNQPSSGINKETRIILNSLRELYLNPSIEGFAVK